MLKDIRFIYLCHSIIYELFLSLNVIIVSFMKKDNMVDIKEFITLVLISVLLGSLLGQIVKFLI